MNLGESEAWTHLRPEGAQRGFQNVGESRTRRGARGRPADSGDPTQSGRRCCSHRDRHRLRLRVPPDLELPPHRQRRTAPGHSARRRTTWVRGAELVHPGRTDGRKWQDETVEEVRTAREAYATQFDYDLDRMFEDLKKKEEQDLAPRANLKPLKPTRTARNRRTRTTAQ